LSDLLRWAGFSWSQRAPFVAGPGSYGLLGVLVMVLVWRLLRGRRTARAVALQAAATARAWPGANSTFYAAEQALRRRFGERAPSEALGPWIGRIAAALDPAARTQIFQALELHQRSRFDPEGINEESARRLGILSADVTRAAQGD